MGQPAIRARLGSSGRAGAERRFGAATAVASTPATIGGIESRPRRPSASGMWEGAPESPPSIRPGGRHDDEGGPGDTPASVAWLRAGRGTGYAADRDRLVPPALVDGPSRSIPESGHARAAAAPDRPARAGRTTGTRRRRRTAAMGRGGDRSKVARVEPEPPPQALGGSTQDLSDWERWLEFCARIDGFPRHLSIHSGGMLVTAAPLIDIAPLERATMKDRVVVQFDKRDVEDAQADQARPARARDARRDRRDAPADRARLRRLRRPRPPARGDPRGLRRCSRRPTPSGSSRSRAGPRCRRCRSRGRRTSTISSSRSRSSGRARSRATPSTRTCAGSRASSR